MTWGRGQHKQTKAGPQIQAVEKNKNKKNIWFLLYNVHAGLVYFE